jgi:hypothetical protein
MDKRDHARKGCILNTNENFYIYPYKQNKKLIEEQRINKDSHRNILFEVSMTYIDTPPYTSHTRTHSITDYQFTTVHLTHLSDHDL